MGLGSSGVRFASEQPGGAGGSPPARVVLNPTRVEIATAQQSSTILVVDDYDANRVLLQDLLQMEGYGVLGASDGNDALRVLEGARPDAILLDLKMPELDGRELLARLQADHDLRDIPVVLVTADRDAGKVTGVFALIKKPFEIPVLLDTVRRCTGLHG